MPRRKPPQPDSTAKRVTIWDVARLAEVSTSTVSRVLSGSTSVDPALSERVRSAASSLRYRPNRAASALAGGLPKLTAVLVPDLQNMFWLEVIRGIEEVMRARGYLVALCNSAEDPAIEEQYVETICAEGVAGAIIAARHERNAQLFPQHGIPVVSVDQRIQHRAIDMVLIDNIAAAREAIAHLIGNGYRRIGLITGPIPTTSGRERREGYRQALIEAGIAYDPRLDCYGPYTEESGRRLMAKLLEVRPAVDAVLLANNRITIGALEALHAHGLLVPDDIAVVGFDEPPWGRPGDLSLTHVVQPAYELGRTAAACLVDRIELRIPPARRQIILEHQLYIGSSSRPKGDSTASRLGALTGRTPVGS